eukprot:214437_1
MWTFQRSIAEWNEIKSKLNQYGSFQNENEKHKLYSVIDYCQRKKITPHQLVHTDKADIVSEMLNDSKFKMNEWQNVFDQIECYVKETYISDGVVSPLSDKLNETNMSMSISPPVNNNQSQNNQDILEHVEQKHSEENPNENVTAPITTV